MKNKKIKKLLNDTLKKQIEFYSAGDKLVIEALPFFPDEIEDFSFQEVSADGLCFGFDYGFNSYLFPIDDFFNKVEEVGRRLTLEEVLRLCI